MKKCDRKCVQKLIERTRRKDKEADFWIPGGAASMYRPDNSRYIGWPGLKYRVPAKKKDGTPAKGKFLTRTYGLEYCPVCGGKL